MSDQDLNVKVTGKTDPSLGAALNEATSQVTRSSAYIRESFDGLGSVVERIKLPFAELAEIVAGGAAFKEIISATEELGVQLDIASRQVGTSASALSSLAIVGAQVDVSLDDMVRGMNRLAYNMQLSLETPSSEAARAFQELGIQVTDSSGRLRPATQIFDDIANRFAHMADGSTKTALAIAIFGRAGADLIPVLDQGAAGIDRLRTLSDDLGATMSESLTSATLKYHAAVVDMDTAWKGLRNTLAEALMPAFTEIARVAASAIVIIRNGFVVLKEQVIAVFEGLGSEIAGFAAAADLAVHGHFQAAGQAIKIAIQDADKDWAVANQHIQENAKQTAAALKLIWNPPAIAVPQGPTPTPPAKPQTDAQIIAEFRQQWQEIKDGQDAFQADMTQEELKFWESKLTEVQRGGKAYLEVQHEVLSLVSQEEREQYALRLSQFKTAEAGITAAGSEGAAQRLAIANQEFQYVAAHYASDTTEYQQALAERMRAVQQFWQQVVAEGKKAAEDQKRLVSELSAAWRSVLSPITNAFARTLTAIVQQTSTFADAMRGMIQSLESSFISSAIRMATQWAAQELAKTVATAAGTTTRTALEQESAAQVLLTWVATGLKEIAIDAARAAAGAYAAIAGIPFVGPVLAPLAAAAALAGVLALGSEIASAAGGYDIPAGVNPITQLHEREMVLPAPLADQVRSGMTGGAVTFNISAVDAQGVARLFAKHGDTIGKIVKGQLRSGALDMNRLGFLST